LGGCRFSQGTLSTDKLFTGQRLDETGLYYYNARYYDAAIGRFISPDTIVQSLANPQTLNRYSYCLNNPLKYVDPSGHIVLFDNCPWANEITWLMRDGWNIPGEMLDEFCALWDAWAEVKKYLPDEANYLENCDTLITIKYGDLGDNQGGASTSEDFWGNITIKVGFDCTDHIQLSCVLAHEGFHAVARSQPGILGCVYNCVANEAFACNLGGYMRIQLAGAPAMGDEERNCQSLKPEMSLSEMQAELNTIREENPRFNDMSYWPKCWGIIRWPWGGTKLITAFQICWGIVK
jgi:RHS repeat-associated protein